MIKAIIFDYYGVLTTDQYLTWLKHNPSVMEENATEIEALSKSQDVGMAADEFFKRLGQIAGLAASEVRDDFGERNIMHLGVLELIRQLKLEGFKTAILSNSSLALYDEVEAKNLSGLFNEVLCSEDAGVVKPERQIFEIMLDRLKVAAEESVFVDDRAYNVHGAEALGIKGILYTDLANLRVELARLGIIQTAESMVG